MNMMQCNGKHQFRPTVKCHAVCAAMQGRSGLGPICEKKTQSLYRTLIDDLHD